VVHPGHQHPRRNPAIVIDMFVRSTAVLTAAIGGNCPAGWRRPAFAQERTAGCVEMKANTAVGLVLAAAPCLSSPSAVAGAAASCPGFGARGGRNWAWPRWGIPVRLAIGIDELLFRRHRGHSTSPAAACHRIARGLRQQRTRAGRLAAGPGCDHWRSAATVMIVIGALSFLGYLWNASSSSPDRLLPPVAVNTAVAFVLLERRNDARDPSARNPKRTPSNRPLSSGK